MRSAIRTGVALAVVSLLVGGCGAAATPTPAPTPGAAAAPSATPVASATPARTAAPTPTRAPSTTPPPLPAPGTDAVQAARAVQSLHERYEAAWATKSVEAAMAFWSDDVRFTDVFGGWRDAPRTEVERMIRNTNYYWPNAASGNLSYFFDATGLVLSADVWGLGDATEADPVHEVDQFDTADGLFTALHTTYDIASLVHIVAWFGNELARSDVAPMEVLIEGYADAWSSGEPSSVAKLYAEAAWRTDTLRGESAEGRQAISDTAARSFSSYPGAVWRVDRVFGDSGVGGVMTGGIFTVRLAEPDACELSAAVVLETNEGQKIVAERVYWEVDSLIRCGLVSSVVSAVPTG
jgi:ketosteroid isomerase-like protein